MQLTLLVKPNSRHREEVLVKEDGSLVVYTKQPAADGKANQSVINLVAEHFGIAKSHVTIIRGHSSTHKVIQIDV